MPPAPCPIAFDAPFSTICPTTVFLPTADATCTERREDNQPAQSADGLSPRRIGIACVPRKRRRCRSQTRRRRSPCRCLSPAPCWPLRSPRRRWHPHRRPLRQQRSRRVSGVAERRAARRKAAAAGDSRAFFGRLTLCWGSVGAPAPAVAVAVRVRLGLQDLLKLRRRERARLRLRLGVLRSFHLLLGSEVRRQLLVLLDALRLLHLRAGPDMGGLSGLQSLPRINQSSRRQRRGAPCP